MDVEISRGEAASALGARARRIRELEAAIRIRRPTVGASRKARDAQNRDEAELRALKKQ